MERQSLAALSENLSRSATVAGRVRRRLDRSGALVPRSIRLLMSESRIALDPAPRIRGGLGLGLLLGAIFVLASACNPGARDARELRGECDDGEPGSCVSLGERVYSGDQVLRDRPHAAQLFQVACDLGDARGCVRLAEMHLDLDAAVSGDRDFAESLLGRACESENLEGCVLLADNFRRGDLAAGLYQRACDGAAPEGCMKLGTMLLEGRRIQADPERAAMLFDQACDEGYMPACVRLGESYADGTGVEADLARAATLYTEACREVMTGCFNLAELHADGRGVERDYAEAAARYQTACDGRAEGGGRVAGIGEACARLGDMYANGTGVERDLNRAARSFSRACRLDYAEACRR